MQKVLIVDDQRYNRTLLKHMLQEHNYFCCDAANGVEALHRISDDIDICLVLMDVDMPVMGGVEATRLIKQKFSSRFIPIVFVTALDENDVMSDCLSVGGDDFISKPVNESALIAKVSAHMRTAGLYNQLQKSNKDLSYHKKLIDREHAIIEHVFRNGMQQFDSSCENLRFNVSPMSMFNGDILLAAPNVNGGLYVLLGDFTGHGLAAAIGCLPVSSVFYAMSRKRAPVSAIAMELNRKLSELLPDNMFCCCVIMEVSAAGDRLTYWSGGMNDMLLMSPDSSVKRIRSQHMPLSILDAEEFDSTTDILSVEPGSRLLAYTDGVIEAQNGQGEMFGETRLERLVSEPGENYMARVLQALHGFRAGESQTDDISIMELHCDTVVHTGLANTAAGSTEQPLSWKLDFEFGAAELKRSNLVNLVVGQLEGFTNLNSHLDTLFTIISELFNNALDHGILGLDSEIKLAADGFETYYKLRQQRMLELQDARINLHLRYSGGQHSELEICCKDSGKGFDAAAKMNQEHDDSLLSGRGLTLLRSLCRSVVYADRGSRATVTYAVE